MIELSKNYRIMFEPNNVVLQQRKSIGKKLKNGEKQVDYHWADSAYFSTVQSAVRHFANLNLKRSTDFDDLLRRLAKLEQQIDKLGHLDAETASQSQKFFTEGRTIGRSENAVTGH